MVNENDLKFRIFIVFTSAPGVLPEQNDRYRIQPWKVNEIKAYKKKTVLLKNSFFERYYFSEKKIT